MSSAWKSSSETLTLRGEKKKRDESRDTTCSKSRGTVLVLRRFSPQRRSAAARTCRSRVCCYIHSANTDQFRSSRGGLGSRKHAFDSVYDRCPCTRGDLGTRFLEACCTPRLSCTRPCTLFFFFFLSFPLFWLSTFARKKKADCKDQVGREAPLSFSCR